MDHQRRQYSSPVDCGHSYTGEAVVCVGTFDGVHLGHQELFAIATELSKERGLTGVVVTFDRHPKRVVARSSAPDVLTTRDEKSILLDRLGLDRTVVMRFDESLAATSAHDFVDTYLVEYLRARIVVVGEDFGFGRNRVGDSTFLKRWAEERGREVAVVGAKSFAEEGRPYCERVSSSGLRSLMRGGEFNLAVEMMGHDYPINGPVVSGAGRGKGLGYPTLNISAAAEKLLPPNGVYAAGAEFGGSIWPGMAYIGGRPTFEDGRTKSIEINLFEFPPDGEIERAIFWLSRHIRGDEKFDSAEALVEQIRKDELEIRRFWETSSEDRGGRHTVEHGTG